MMILLNMVNIFNLTKYNYFFLGFNGCGKSSGYIFFIIFHLIVSIVCLNLFIAMTIISSCDIIKVKNAAVSVYQINDIKALWMTFDPMALGFINYKDFWRFTS